MKKRQKRKKRVFAGRRCKRMYGKPRKPIITESAGIQMSKRVYNPKTQHQSFLNRISFTVVGYEYEEVVAIIQNCLDKEFGKIDVPAPRRHSRVL